MQEVIDYLSFKLCIRKDVARQFLTDFNIKNELELINRFKTPQAMEKTFWNWLKGGKDA